MAADNGAECGGVVATAAEAEEPERAQAAIRPPSSHPIQSSQPAKTGASVHRTEKPRVTITKKNSEQELSGDAIGRNEEGRGDRPD
mmetsp:Transcript_54540/g.115861  ORF Transcript_54540/g.115861 Transcript_54540/m.115861 type:complete len:86 (-) Transcript_54540:717-974(-)